VLRTYYYDTHPLQSGFSQNSQGRLTAVQYPDPLNRFPSADPLQFVDMYSYVAPGTAGAGLPATKRLQVNESYNYMSGGHEYNETETGNLDTTFTYNNEGKISSMTYPSTVSGSTTTPGPSYNYSYDSMYRLSGMTSGSTTVVNGVSYNAANQLAGITYNGYAESRTYNALNQLITLKVQESINTFENLTYNYPTGANNGKLSSINNAVSVETVTYAYDSLNRLLTASGSGWGESYGFDPFGNLLSKTVSSGSGPSLLQTVNTANNRVGGLSYDANGNPTISFNGTQEVSMTYDAENRLIGAANFNGPPMSIYYAYDGQNRRIFSWNGSLDSLNNPINYTVNVYTPGGQKLAAYTMSPDPSSCGVTPCLNAALATSDQYFGRRRLAVMDQLGSVENIHQSYFPWGEPKGTSNPQDTWNFATYWADSATGMDYANNRYYSNAYGRMMTPDPSSSADAKQPQSWNQYAYSYGDPVNNVDPSGLYPCGSTTTVNDDGVISVTVYDCGNFGAVFPGGASGTGQTPSQQKGQHATWNPSAPPPPCKPAPQPGGLPSASTVIAQNIALAQQMSQQFFQQAEQVANEDPGDSVSNLYDTYMTAWLISQFKAGGAWDYKANQSLWPSNVGTNNLQNFGNFNFGAVLQSLGVSYYWTQNAAGIYQALGIGQYSQGIPLLQWPYGDSVADAQVVQQGFAYESFIQVGCKN